MVHQSAGDVLEVIAPVGSNHLVQLLELEIPSGLIGFYQREVVK